MKTMMLVLCCLIAFLSNANAGEMYNCIDRDGNTIFTDIPQEDMKCVSKGSSINPSPIQQAETKHIEERKTIKREKMTGAFAENLNGTWIFDAKATADYIAGSPQYHGAYKTAEHFGIGGHYLCIFMYEFNGDIVTVSPLHVGRTKEDKKSELRLLSRKGSEIQYIDNKDATRTKGSKPNILTVVVLNSNNIKIVYSGQEDMDFLLWKHMTPSDEKLILQQSLIDSWVPSLEKIGKVLNAESEDGNLGRGKINHK